MLTINPTRVSVGSDLRKRDEKTGEIMEYPDKIGAYGHSLQFEIKDAECTAVELVKRLSSLAEEEWNFSNTKAATLAERYSFYWQVLRKEFLDFERSAKMLLCVLHDNLLRNAATAKEGEEKEGASSSSSTSTSPTLSKTLCTIADSKQLLLDIWGYLVNQEGTHERCIAGFDEMGDEEDMGEDLRYFDGLFRKVEDISATINAAEKRDFDRRAWRNEFYGYGDEKINEDVRDFPTYGIFRYLEDRGITIKHYKGWPYIEAGLGKRLFVRFVDKTAGTFAISYNWTFDSFAKVSFRELLQELRYE